MTTKNKIHFSLAIIALIATSLACGLPGANQVAVDEAVQATLAAREVEPAVEDSSGDTVEESSEVTEVEATEEPTAEPPTPTPTVQHLVIPSSPASVQSFMTDRSTASLAGERRAIGDNFDINLLERPFTAESMDYKDFLDITRAEMSLNPPFMYVTVHLEGSAPADSTAAYGVEVDTDIDGHGDWLVLGMVPPDSTWTTDGVRACRDANGDVGGPTPMRTDLPHASRDGYEDCVFDSGYGVGPDEAWIRRDPSHADRVQIAFLFSLIGSDGQFTWGAWSDDGVHEPDWFDYHDHFTLTEAGSPASESSNYPLKTMPLMDNTCRWGYGFTPNGSEIGVCYVPPTPTPEPTGSISGYVYRGTSGSPSSPRFPGVTVLLGQGGCTSSGYKSTTTGRDGSYTFTGLPAGQYCVTVNSSTLPSASYGWGSMSPSFPATSCPPFNPYQGVNLGANENKSNINFAFLEIVG
jgi:hypothetical protein